LYAIYILSIYLIDVDIAIMMMYIIIASKFAF